jgi:hypothetical protein
VTPIWIPRKVAGLPELPSLTPVDVHPGVVIHCTGGSSRPSSRRDALQRVRIIQASHTLERGWRYAGYHFAVLPTGEIVELRGWGVIGAHAKGHNRWVGVVVLGRGVSMTADEQHGLEAVIAAHLARGGGHHVLPHNAVSSKSCPGPAVTAWLAARYAAPVEVQAS